MTSRLLLGLLAAGALTAAPPLDPNLTEFPSSSLVDFGARLDSPGGFLTVDERGRFVWPDGRRARFWGINVAAESVFQPPERIDTCIARIREAGFNLVRLHHIDDRERGILAGDGPGVEFDPARLRLLDYWVDRLGAAGISIYLDLLDYRWFDTGRLGRAAKPYAVFDPELIARQQEYARALLQEHRNAFNGRAYADDPAIVLLELFDENGLFIRRADWPNLLEPYRSDLTARWNRYLLQRYGSSEGLAAAWARSGVAQPLPAGQRCEEGTVPLPALRLEPDTAALAPAVRLARARQADAARFAYQLHLDYYRTMKDYLRKELGVRVPLTAVGDFEIMPDLRAVAEELDFLGTNFYWDHPIFRAATPWRMPFFFHYRHPLSSTDSAALAPYLAMARMHRKPLVVREWNPCFPNPYRAAGMVEATAYAALQDVDAMILFTYGAVETHRKIGYFDVHQDPPRWGLAGVLGEVFRSGAVAPARRRIDLGYSDVDTFLFKEYRHDLRHLAWVSRLANRCFDDALDADADLTIASGRSAGARYQGGPLLLSRHDPAADTLGGVATATADLLGYPVALTQRVGGEYRFDGFLYPSGPRRRAGGGRFLLSDLAALGARPIGLGAGDAVGFHDPRRRVYGFGPLTPREQLRAGLDALTELYGEGPGAAAEQSGRYLSDTGELLRDSAAGRLLIDTPTAVAVAGQISGRHQLGDLTIDCASPRGAVVIVSLDGLPLVRCQRFVAKLVTNAQNSAMAVSAPGPRSNPRGYYRLDEVGKAPILTYGRPVAGGWRVARSGRTWFSVDLAGGTAEVVGDPQGWRSFVDTPGVKVVTAEGSP